MRRSPLAVQLSRFGAYASPGTVAALKRYRSGLGATTNTGVLVSKGVSLGAGAAATAALTAVGGAALGAAAGSVVPIVGTVIGAVVGYLTSKLFGTADYAQVYSDVTNQLQLFEAYEGVAGQYPGRVYGWPEIHYVFYGAMFYGLFPGNGTTWGTCTQASISKNINYCGTSAWLDDWIGAGAPNPGSGSNNIVNLVGTAISHGVTDPRLIASQYLVPGAEAVALGKNNAWISVKNSRDPALYTQMLVDIADVIISTKYPNTPIYYGGIPGGSNVPTQSAAAQPNVATSNTQASVAAMTSQAIYTAAASAAAAPAVASSPAGSSIKAGAYNAVLTTAQGSWVFGSSSNAAGQLVYLNGLTTQGYGVLLSLNASGALILTDASNNTYQWTGSAWSPLTTATAANQTPAATAAAVASALANPASAPAISAAGSTISPSSAGSLVSPAGTWTFGASNDGQGNYQILLNGSAASAGNSNATQLQINSAGTVVATISNGATYGWGNGGWTSISAPVTALSAVSTPNSISADGSTILPGAGAQLVTAQGEWTFSTQTDGTGNYYALLNGSVAGAEAGVQLTILNSIPSLLRNDGSTWTWSGTAWTQQTAATGAAGTASPSSLLNPPAPVDDSSSYDDGPSPDGLGSNSYAPGYSATAATPVVPVVAGMSTNEKILLYGGGAAALLAILFGMSRHGSGR